MLNGSEPESKTEAKKACSPRGGIGESGARDVYRPTPRPLRPKVQVDVCLRSFRWLASIGKAKSLNRTQNLTDCGLHRKQNSRLCLPSSHEQMLAQACHVGHAPAGLTSGAVQCSTIEPTMGLFLIGALPTKTPKPFNHGDPTGPGPMVASPNFEHHGLPQALTRLLERRS